MLPDAERTISGDHIANARRLRGLCQRELARRLRMRQPDLNELERGRREIPDGPADACAGDPLIAAFASYVEALHERDPGGLDQLRRETLTREQRC